MSGDKRMMKRVPAMENRQKTCHSGNGDSRETQKIRRYTESATRRKEWALADLVNVGSRHP